jgi:flagellar secretion chaperone FliS
MRQLAHTTASISDSRRTKPALVAHGPYGPYGLDLMLIDSALEHIALARRWMDHQEHREKDHLLTVTVQIVRELQSSVELYAGHPHAANLDDLCDYMSRQLVTAKVQDRVEKLDEVADLLREVRNAWMMVPYV